MHAPEPPTPPPHGQGGGPRPPWSGALGPAGLACLVPWSSGPDPRLDGLVRLSVARLAADGSWEGREVATRPFVVGEAAGVHKRLWQSFGVDAAALADAPPPADAWRELREFIGERVVLAPDGELAAAWVRALDEECGFQPSGDDPQPTLTVIGLEEVALLLMPGRLALRRDGLVRALLPSDVAPSPPGALSPPHVLYALTDLVARFQGRGPTTLALATRGWTRAAQTFQATDVDAARRLRIVMDLVDRPSRWSRDLVELARVELNDELLTRASTIELGDEDPLAALDPAWTRDSHHDAAELDSPPLPPDREDPAPFAPEDLRVLDEVFKEHLPTMFGAPGSYRKSQHRVAEAIASALGDDAFILVHAPTGTGKTLAYLLPALLFARRYDMRVGVATYTRALQEQAMDREVPRALAALGRAGQAPGFRVATLKGREHSLCWRALRATSPGRHDEPETWLAWTALALFALSDVDGDLDRFPQRPPIRLTAASPWRARMGALLRQVRARAGCCSHADDRQRCAAEVSRRKAERSHVVITNQAFALARPEFFRRIIFDECEHLHDQAGSAYSTRYALTTALDAVIRISVPNARTSGARGERGGGALDRLKRALPLGSSIADRTDAARGEANQLLLGLGRLERELERYEAWRDERLATLDPRHAHALFRVYAEGLDSGRSDRLHQPNEDDTPSDDGREDEEVDVHAERLSSSTTWDPSEVHARAATRCDTDEAAAPISGLVFARERVAASAGRLDGWLTTLGEELALLHLRRIGRVRRALELGRQDLAELGAALGQWLPVDASVPRLSRGTFHDVERNARGELVLSARVLLPDRLLGREVLPKFASAAFVSATTKLGGSFEIARKYLGLDQLAASIPGVPAGTVTVDYDPAELHREDPNVPPGEVVRPDMPREVRTMSAPEVFDYSRVLIGVPLDLPSPQREREAWLARIGAWLPTFAEHTGGRILALFTSLADVRALAERMAPEFRARSLPLYWQGMEGAGKEELADQFRERVEATLLGVDTFWYGADFPGDTLEVVLIARLPYGVPDRFHFAQCAVLGEGVQRHRIYMPRALSKFRQGFGRLMRRASDRGAVLSLDPRLADRRHAAFLRELPLARSGVPGSERGAAYVQGSLAEVTRATLAHLGRGPRTTQAQLTPSGPLEGAAAAPAHGRQGPPQDPQLGPLPAPQQGLEHGPSAAPERPGPLEIDVDDLPF
ncbi:MAG: ATP-dependent DNA helicase [Planctomycetota bacterium]